PDLPSETRTFQGKDGQEFTLTFRPHDALSGSQIGDVTQKLIRRFLGTDEEAPEEAFPPIGGVDVSDKLSETLFQNAATFETMQPPDCKERYNALDFVAIAA